MSVEISVRSIECYHWGYVRRTGIEVLGEQVVIVLPDGVGEAIQLCQQIIMDAE